MLNLVGEKLYPTQSYEQTGQWQTPKAYPEAVAATTLTLAKTDDLEEHHQPNGDGKAR